MGNFENPLYTARGLWLEEMLVMLYTVTLSKNLVEIDKSLSSELINGF